jgi:hypothetical protein
MSFDSNMRSRLLVGAVDNIPTSSTNLNLCIQVLVCLLPLLAVIMLLLHVRRHLRPAKGEMEGQTPVRGGQAT